MRRGIEAQVAAVLLVALAVIIGGVTYFYVAGTAGEAPKTAEEGVEISVVLANATNAQFLVTNTDSRAVTLIGLETSQAGVTCNFTTTTTLQPGESALCALTQPISGEFFVFSSSIESATVQAGTVNTAPSVNTPQVSSGLAKPGGQLNCTVNATDDLSSTLSLAFTWYRNNARNTSFDVTLTAPIDTNVGTTTNVTGLVQGDEWKCAVNATDGSWSSGFTNSSAKTVYPTYTELLTNGNMSNNTFTSNFTLGGRNYYVGQGWTVSNASANCQTTNGAVINSTGYGIFLGGNLGSSFCCSGLLNQTIDISGLSTEVKEALILNFSSGAFGSTSGSSCGGTYGTCTFTQCFQRWVAMQFYNSTNDVFGNTRLYYNTYNGIDPRNCRVSTDNWTLLSTGTAQTKSSRTLTGVKPAGISIADIRKIEVMAWAYRCGSGTNRIDVTNFTLGY
jgi:hypothetical protein